MMVLFLVDAVLSYVAHFLLVVTQSEQPPKSIKWSKHASRALLS